MSEPAPTTIYVCINCRLSTEAPEPRSERAGAKLHTALAAAVGDDQGLRLQAVECLSVCKRPVTIGFAAAGKWTYVYGDFAPESAEALIDCAKSFASAPDGLIPWKERPEALKRGVIARLPPTA